jgi:hypothetical protein
MKTFLFALKAIPVVVLEITLNLVAFLVLL